jgi:hypothetical protein
MEYRKSKWPLLILKASELLWELPWELLWELLWELATRSRWVTVTA